MPDPIPGQSQTKPTGADTDTNKLRADIVDRRNESRRYQQINYWDLWEDIFRASKCRTKPIMVVDKTGNEVEDKTRTNVAMPEMSLIIRRKTARMTANPPQINYTVEQGGDSDLADKLTAWSYQQFDRSGEAQEHRKIVQCAQTFGHAVSKTSWDTVEQTKNFYRDTAKLDRKDMELLQGGSGDGASEMDTDTTQNADLTDDERSQAIAQYGNTVQLPTKISQFEGPITKYVFTGDFFMEPGCANLNVSAWAIENYWEGDVWLKKMLSKTWIDPENGQERPVFDSKAVAELESLPTWQPSQSQQPFDLRSRLRTEAQKQTLPLFPTKLIKGKRYDVLECHTKDEYGKFWIEWIGNEKVYLGKMCYPWDLYGKYCYTELVPMFDLLSAYGDSTPMLLRHLWLLHNTIVGSRRDLIANLLRPLMKMKTGANIADEQIDRAFMRVIQMSDPSAIEPLMDNPNNLAAVAAANEEEAQNMRMMALAEPNLTNVESGTEANPQAGKTATTAVLAAKSADALTQFEIDSLNWYLKEVGEKKLAMLQQTEPETDDQGQYNPIQVAAKYTDKVEGLTQRYGKANVASIDFMELQQEIQVEPAAMSMLSVDDDIRRDAAQKLVSMASAMPNVVDPFYAAHFYASTIRGIDPDKAVPPPKPPTPPPPKVTISVSVKAETTPPAVQAQIYQGITGQPIDPQAMEEMNVEHTLKGIEKMSSAADHADNLMSNKSVDDEPTTNMAKGVGNPNPASKQ